MYGDGGSVVLGFGAYKLIIIISESEEEAKEGIIIILSDARELSESEAAGASGRILEPRLLHLKGIWEKWFTLQFLMKRWVCK